MSLSEHVWYKHPQACWALGEVKQLQGEQIELNDAETQRKLVVPVADTYPCDPSHLQNLDDIAQMNNMHEAPLLNLLKRRYKNDQIYTFTGEILISINPYRLIDKLYDLSMEGDDADLDRFRDHKIPHVFSVAAVSYATMMKEQNPARKSQSMIVSGESGAGKTEACKQVMKYLAAVSERYCAQSGIQQESNRTANIEHKVLKCNPFLEAFGNAKTLRNNNSSRFGKFLKIQYNGGRIVGAFMQHYLLEKARVCLPHHGERNYHIFYQLCRGSGPALRSQLQLDSVDSYHYLCAGGSTDVEDLDDVEDFKEVCSSLQVVGIDSTLQEGMWRVLAAILHLGNVQFQDILHTSGESHSKIKNLDTVKRVEYLIGCPELGKSLTTQFMRVGGETLKKFQSARTAGNSRDAVAKHVYDRLFSWLVTKVNESLASPDWDYHFIGILDIFGFEIFDLNSFEQLCINYANEKLQSLFNHHIFTMEQQMYRDEGVDVQTISFRNNQACVELIENSRPPGILTLLDDVCRNQRKDMTDEKFLDMVAREHAGKNHYFVTTKHKQFDRFSVSHFAGDVTYCIDNFIDKNNDKLNEDLQQLMEESEFDFVRMLFMNADAERAATGASPVLQNRHTSPTRFAGNAAGGRKRTGTTAQTIAGRFRKQLQKLHATLLKTTPHYIRTIKPNEYKRPKDFDADKILQQLLYSGVLETVRIRREGFPFRENYVDFWRRATRCGSGISYTTLLQSTEGLPSPPPPADYQTGEDGALYDASLNDQLRADAQLGTRIICERLLTSELWIEGRTKIFMKNGALNSIHERFRKHIADFLGEWYHRRSLWLRFRLYRVSKIRQRIACRSLSRQYEAYLLKKRFEKVVSQVASLQAHIRRRQVQRYYRNLLAKRRMNAIKLQATYRMHRCYRDRMRTKHGIARLQGVVRGVLQRSRTRKIRLQVLLCQAVVRMMLVRRRLARRRRARKMGCVKVQAWWRMYQQRRRYLAFLSSRRWSASVLIQCIWRGYAARQLAQKRWHALRLFQTNVRTWLYAKNFRRRFRAKRIIVRWLVAKHRNYVLRQWVSEVFAAAINGCAEDLLSLLTCQAAEYRLLQSLDITELSSIRDFDDGFKSLMHAAALSGDVSTVKLLQQYRVPINGVDASGATPLHKAASIGDSHLAVMQHLVFSISAHAFPPDGTTTHQSAVDAVKEFEQLIASGVFDQAKSSYKRAVQRKSASSSMRSLFGSLTRSQRSLSSGGDFQEHDDLNTIGTTDDVISDLFDSLRDTMSTPNLRVSFLTHKNYLRESALDVAVTTHRTRGRRDHDATIAFLVAAGSGTGVLSQPSEALTLVHGSAADIAVAEAAAAREKLALERRKQERLNNPHYQYLVVQEQERKRQLRKQQEQQFSPSNASNMIRGSSSSTHSDNAESYNQVNGQLQEQPSHSTKIPSAGLAQGAIAPQTPHLGSQSISDDYFRSRDANTASSNNTLGKHVSSRSLVRDGPPTSLNGHGQRNASKEQTATLRGLSSQRPLPSANSFRSYNAAPPDIPPEEIISLRLDDDDLRTLTFVSESESTTNSISHNEISAQHPSQTVQNHGKSNFAPAGQHSLSQSTRQATTSTVNSNRARSSTYFDRQSETESINNGQMEARDRAKTEPMSDIGFVPERTASPRARTHNMYSHASFRQTRPKSQKTLLTVSSAGSGLSMNRSQSYRSFYKTLPSNGQSVDVMQDSENGTIRAYRPSPRSRLSSGGTVQDDGSTVHTAATRMSETHGNSQQMQQTQEHVHIDPMWGIYESRSTGLLYYHNRETGEATWSEPPDFDGHYEEWHLRKFRQMGIAWTNRMRDDFDHFETSQRNRNNVDELDSVADAVVDHVEGSADPSSGVHADTLGSPISGHASYSSFDLQQEDFKEKLPNGIPQDDGPSSRWEVYTTDSGHVYYFDAWTQRTQWEQPKCLENNKDVTQLIGTEKQTETDTTDENGYIDVDEDQVIQGANGWICVTDDRGYVYYHNTKVGTTQWERPVDF